MHNSQGLPSISPLRGKDGLLSVKSSLLMVKFRGKCPAIYRAKKDLSSSALLSLRAAVSRALPSPAMPHPRLPAPVLTWSAPHVLLPTSVVILKAQSLEYVQIHPKACSTQVSPGNAEWEPKNNFLRRCPSQDLGERAGPSSSKSTEPHAQNPQVHHILIPSRSFSETRS